MKRSFLLLLLIALTCTARSQNWKPVQSGDRYLYYLDGHGFDSTAVVLQSDSFSVTGLDTTVHLNRVVRRTSAPGDIRLVNQPQFLLRELTFRSDGTFACSDPATLAFRPFEALNVAWLFDTANGITATIISAGTQAVFSISDSVKTLLLSNGDTIKISRSCGILQFPSAQSGVYYRLAGITGRGLGIAVPGFYDLFYSIQPGDVLGYYITDYVNNYPTPSNHTGYYWHRDSLLSKAITANGVSLTFYRERSDTIVYTNSTGTVYGTTPQTVTVTFTDDTVSGLDHTGNGALLYWGLPKAQPLMYDSNGVFSCRTIKTDPHFINPMQPLPGDSAAFATTYSTFGPPGIMHVMERAEYGAGVGLIYMSSYNGGTAYNVSMEQQLIYARINGIEYGVALPLQVPDQQQAVGGGLSPNPVQGTLYFNTTWMQSAYPQPVIRNILGEEMPLNYQSGSVDVSALPNGVYFFDYGTGSVVRFVKQ